MHSLLTELFKDKKFGPGAIPKPQNEKRSIIGGISPQAGLVFSGYASAHTFFHLFKEKIPDTVVILAPDLAEVLVSVEEEVVEEEVIDDFHEYYEEDIEAAEIMVESPKIIEKAAFGLKGWDMPFGRLEIDTELAIELRDSEFFMVEDHLSYWKKTLKRFFVGSNVHSIEIQLTFINFLSERKNIKILPIIIPSRLSLEKINSIAVAIYNAINKINKDIIVIASASMYHASSYEKDKYRQLDRVFINEFTKFEIENTYYSLLNTPNNGQTTIPLLMMICKYLGAKSCRQLKYYTSDDIFDIMGSNSHYSVAYFSGISAF